MHILWVLASWFCGTPNCGSRYVSFALYDYSLFCHIWPFSLGGLFFFDRRQKLSVSRIKKAVGWKMGGVERGTMEKKKKTKFKKERKSDGK